MTSETSEFWALPNGSVRVEAHLGPVRLRDGKGGWTPVDFTLAYQADGTVAAKAHPNGLRLAGASGPGEHDLVTLTQGDNKLVMGWSGALPAPAVAGTRATYTEVRRGVDLVIESTRTGFEQFLVIKNRDAIRQVRKLPLRLRGTGLKIAEDGTGGFEIKDNGDVVGVSPGPVMWDAQVDARSGERRRRTAVPSRVAERRADGVKVVLEPDETWLADAATQFPVTIDPGVTLKPNYDAFVQEGYTSDQSAATELRLGTYDGGATIARSYLRFDNLSFLWDKHIQSGTLYLWNFHSWSCEIRQWELWRTGSVGTATRWTSQPTYYGGTPAGISSQTKGYSGCADGWVSVPAGPIFQVGATNHWYTAAMGLKATTETDSRGWKKFASMEAMNDPYVSLTYTSMPTVNAQATVPSTACVTGTARPYINSTTPQLRAQITDPEGAAVKAQFEWWVTGGSAPIGGTTVGPGASGSWLSATVPTGVFANSGTYSWRVRGYDGIVYGPWRWCEFTVDTAPPTVMPTVSSSNYPEGQWAGGAGTPASFAFSASGVADVTAYQYGLDVNPPNQTVNPTSLGGGASVSVPIPNDGPHTLYVRSVDRAGNQSAIKSYQFNVGSAGVTAPKTGDVTAAKTAITSVASPGITSVTYQWRRGEADAWTTIPAGDVTKAAGGTAITWPFASSGGGVFDKLNWDVAKTLNDAEAGADPLDGPLQLRGLFNGGAASSPVTITFDKNTASAATADIGPCSVNLITGNCLLSDSDVSVDSYGSDLTVTRSYNTRRPAETDSANMFGPGWVSGVMVEETDAPYTNLNRVGSLVQVGLPDGETIGFAKKANITGGESFDPEIGMEDLKLTYTTESNSYTLSDWDGNTVTFTEVTGAPALTYSPTAITVPGSNQTTTISWQSATVDGKTVVRPTRMLAPVPDGVNCTTMARGCRAVNVTYATATTATGGTETEWGDYLGRVKEVTFTAWDPDLSTPAMRTVVLARYAYDNTGRLRASWDPRLDWIDAGVQRHLWDTYTYNPDGILTTITPTGQEPWQLSYTTVPADSGKGRLKAATRSALAAGTATTTVVYRVPISGTGAPYDLSGSQTARWYQTEPPTDAAAIFPATQIPDGDQAAGTLPSSWERAAVTYMDANAREVNTAQPGGHITTSWYDQWGNVTRTLTAGNRKRALDASSSDTAAAEAILARDWSTLNQYSSDGQRLTATWGPSHDVMLPNGSVVRGRAYTTNTYDEGAPTTGAPYNLVTTQVQQVRVWDNTTGGEVNYDPRTTKTEYDWTLRQPTATIVDPSGLSLKTRTSYEPVTGLVTSTTAPPGGASDTTPYTRKIIYYRATSGSGYAECDLRPEWANLPCQIQPGGQPASGPELPVTVTTYDMFNQPRVVVEKISTGTLRTTTTTYDDAGRPDEETVTAANGLGTAVPKRRSVYDPATGQLIRTQSIDSNEQVTAQVVRGFDTLGRQISYTDADNNTSTTTYDLMSRPRVANDGKAVRTYTYDETTEPRGLATTVDDTQAGGFGGSYDSDGNLVSETWPNGIVVTNEYDETGTQIGLSYTKPNCGQEDCTLYHETVIESAHGQWRDRVSTLSSQKYTYDAAGRLTAVADNVSGGCTTRVYGFATATSHNRASLTEYGPNVDDGSCQTTTAASTRGWSYDAADRVTTAGTVYDALSRTTTVPAADTATPGGGNVTIGYHVTDLVKTITQGTRTTNYTLDVDGERIRFWTDNATGTTVQATHHYDSDDDNPAWTQETATHYTRVLAGIAGMAGIWNSDTATIGWKLANLHGDVAATINAGDTGLSATHEATEYGTPRNAAAIGTQRYGWLGGKQRAADTPAGIVLMGVRLYNTAAGRFLQVDPIYGGNANAYDYCSADPINCFDLDGKWGRWFKKNWTSVLKMGLGAAALTFCALPCGLILAGWSAWDMYGSLKDRNYGKAAWDAFGVISFGWGQRLRYLHKGASATSKFWRTKAATRRTKSGSTYRRYLHRSQAKARKAHRYSRHQRRLRWAEYGHWGASSTWDLRAR